MYSKGRATRETPHYTALTVTPVGNRCG